MVIVDQVAKRFLRTAVVAEVRDLGSFRRLDLRADEAGWTPGSKVQVWLRGTTLRTYTPFGWGEGTVSLLVHQGGSGPAGPWIAGVARGDELRLLGPRRSLVLSELDAAPVVVGDETSFAVAAAWAQHGTAPAVAQVFEVTDRADADAALAHLGLGSAELVDRRPGDAHHPELATRVVAALEAHPGAPLVLTGQAQSIRAIRGAVRDAGLRPTVRVKAYWDANRAGLD